jgi:hypothetical protein
MNNAPKTDDDDDGDDGEEMIPKTPQNPWSTPDIDQLINQQFNADMWQIMKGALPCLETSATCLQQLQEKAVAQSPLLKEIDSRITEANNKISEAKVSNQRSIKLSVFTPGLQYLLGVNSTNTGQSQPRQPGLLDRIGGLFRGNVGIINDLLRVVGIPLFEGTQGGNEQAQNRAIQISDIQVKVAELQRSRAQLADTIREKTIQALINFDEARTNYQTSQIIVSRSVQRFRVYELRYIWGHASTEDYLSHQNQLDSEKAQVYSNWAKMRRQLFQIKLIVLSVKDAEN